MPLVALSFSTLLLSLAVTANPTVSRRPRTTLSMTRHVSKHGTYNILQRDQARAQRLMTGTHGSAAPVNAERQSDIYRQNITNAVVMYTASIGIGTPPTNYDLMVDTGSSNTWVGANKSFVPTSSAKATGQFFDVTYGSGFAFGLEWLDTVRLTDDLILDSQSIGVSLGASDFQRVDGILGLGPTILTKGSLLPDIDSDVPTVVDNACPNLDTCEIGIWFRPSASGDTAGEIFYGGTDSSKYTGTLHYTPVTNTSPASKHWGFDQSITYGTNAESILSLTAGIVDTGTTLILLATDAFDAYRKATGGVKDSVTGLLKLTPEQFKNLQSLFFSIGGVTFELTPDAQKWPSCLNEGIGGTSESIYLVVNDLGQNSGSGFNFINGYTFLERFYSSYDTTNNRVGLATTPYTKVVVNNRTSCSGH